ncbi:MAG TPA: hypothetical protein VEI82_09815, partial [Myxococcota bacterium]|nr:hypothetical protein [Myxococcota bacterium]
FATGTAAPCLSVFKPVRVHEPLDLGPAPADRFDPAALWWRHEELHRVLIADPERAGDYLAERDALEARIFAAPESPAAAFALADELLRRWLERIRAQPRIDRRPLLVRRYWQKRDARAGLRFDGA